MTQNAPLDLSSSRNQTLLDFSGTCQWRKIKKDLRLQWDFKRFPHDELADRTQEFLNAVEQESKMGYNQYIIVTASRLGSGKSESALWLCWMFDKEFSIENCLVYNLPQVARIVQRRKRDFWMAFDEPQEELASINWMNLPDSTKRFIVTQRENHINIVYATPNIQRLWYVIKDNYNYNLHITYRCMPSATNQGHVHGIIYCVTPDTLVMANPEPTPISSLKVGEKVLTADGTFAPIKQVLTHDYKGELYEITPAYSNIPIRVTGDHPFLVLQNRNWHKWVGSRGHYLLRRWNRLPRKVMPYTEWKPAQNLRKHGTFKTHQTLQQSDYLVIPRMLEVEDLNSIDLTKYHHPNIPIKVNRAEALRLRNQGWSYGKIGRRFHSSSSTAYEAVEREQRNGRRLNYDTVSVVPITPDFMRLLGYYISEGDVNKESIHFTFNESEFKYVNDVVALTSPFTHVPPSVVHPI